MTIDVEQISPILASIIEALPDVDAFYVMDRQGLILTAKQRESTLGDIPGLGLTRVIDVMIEQIITEFKAGNFGSGYFDAETPLS